MTRNFEKCDLNFLILLPVTIHTFGNIPRGVFKYLLPNKAGLFEGSFFWGVSKLTPVLI